MFRLLGEVCPGKRMELKVQQDSKPRKQGTAFEWPEPEPWPEAVAGDHLLDEIAKKCARHVVLADGAADAIALWVLYTWTYEAFGISPILAITSPTKRCGKTTVVTLLQALTRRALAASSVTPAALFRFIEREQPTLIVDEADRFLLRNEELTGILNAGHTKATARVIRTVGEDFEARTFSTWCPKAIAMIGKLEGTIQDRAIEVRMRRKTNAETTEVLRADRIPDEFACVHRQAVRWASDNSGELAKVDPVLPTHLHSRAQDNWRPLFAIAEVAGKDWPARTERAASLLNAGHQDDEDLGLLVLADIRRAFQGNERIPSARLIELLQADAERPWSEWWPNTASRELAKLLRPFGIRSRKIRFASGPAQGYLGADFADAFQRYLPQEPEHAEHLEHAEHGQATLSIDIHDEVRNVGVN
jgi:hypothetical protein